MPPGLSLNPEDYQFLMGLAGIVCAALVFYAIISAS
jgi:hypothetical protein